MKYSLLLLFGFLSVTVLSQEFENAINKAGSLYETENYLESGKTYEIAFEFQDGSASNYYDAACSWALGGDTDNAIGNLNLAAEKGWKNKGWMLKDKDLYSLHELSDWDLVLQKVQENLDEYEKDFDKVLMNQLKEIYVKDQMLRQLYSDAEEKFGNDSDEMNYFWQLMNQIDGENEAEVVQIIDEHGWLGESTVGEKANMTLWVVIQHAPLETQEKYLPLLKESVMNGESSGGDLALLEDRILMRNNKPQTYGSQITTDSESGEQTVYEIEEPEYVNQRRAEVGLGSIEEYVKIWGIEWTIEQKEK